VQVGHLASSGMLKGSGQRALTFCGCRQADKSALQGCWTKGEHAGGLSSVAWDAAAMVGEHGGTVLRASVMGHLV